MGGPETDTRGMHLVQPWESGRLPGRGGVLSSLWKALKGQLCEATCPRRGRPRSHGPGGETPAARSPGGGVAWVTVAGVQSL